jgi:hypothetical protein
MEVEYIPYKNYGQTPALNLKVTRASFQQITKEILEAKEYTTGTGIVVPNGDRGLAIDINEEGQKKILAGNEYLWIGILIEYEFGKNEKGEYCLIGEYNFKTQHDRTSSEWAK